MTDQRENIETGGGLPGCRSFARLSFSRGYSLIEVLIAAAIIAVGIGGAALLGMTLISQQEGAARVTRALNYQEQACRLYQLGVAPSVVTNILPGESAISSLTFTTSSVATNAQIGTVERGDCAAVITAGSRFSAGSPQTNTIPVVRPSIR